MSLYDYNVAKEIERSDPPFDALLMAAMRKASTMNGERLAFAFNTNGERLAFAFPAVWDELKARWSAPGGLLPDDDGGVS